MGCGGSKEKLTPAEKRAMMMQKAMKSANKPTQAQLNRRESTHLVINISEELQRWDGTNELENVKLEDRYQHVKALGAGAFGTVSKVERMGDLKMLAAKEILRERCVQQEQWQLALQETRTWKELSSPYHPAILQLIEVLYTADKSIYLLTEVMPGGELAEAFDHMEMTEQKCRLIAVQITAAIGHLHMAHSMASPSPIERGLDITGGGLNVARPCARAATSRGRALTPMRPSPRFPRPLAGAPRREAAECAVPAAAQPDAGRLPQASRLWLLCQGRIAHEAAVPPLLRLTRLLCAGARADGRRCMGSRGPSP